MEFDEFLGTPVKREADENPDCILGLETHLQALNSTTGNRLQRGPIMRSVATLRLHSSLAEFDRDSVLSEFGDATGCNTSIMKCGHDLDLCVKGKVRLPQWKTHRKTGIRSSSKQQLS